MLQHFRVIYSKTLLQLFCYFYCAKSSTDSNIYYVHFETFKIHILYLLEYFTTVQPSAAVTLSKLYMYLPIYIYFCFRKTYSKDHLLNFEYHCLRSCAWNQISSAVYANKNQRFVSDCCNKKRERGKKTLKDIAIYCFDSRHIVTIQTYIRHILYIS